MAALAEATVTPLRQRGIMRENHDVDGQGRSPGRAGTWRVSHKCRGGDTGPALRLGL